MDTDLVSVIMSVYNTPVQWLKEAVSSILNQTYKNIELLIVDDNSDSDLFTDNMFLDTRIKIYRSGVNLGPGGARNRALSMAQGKYIAIMDSDDISMPNRIEEQVAFLTENKGIVACGSWFQYFGEKQSIVARMIDDNEYYRCCLLFGNAPTLLNPSVMIRKQVLDDHHIVYDEKLLKAEDYKMWVELSAIGRVTNIDKVLVHYRFHKNQTSNLLRTYDTSPYDWSVMKFQYDLLGLEISKDEESMLAKNCERKDVDAYSYFLWLQKILQANRKAKIYDQKKLDKRIEEQWKRKLFSIKNPITLLRLLLKLDGKQRKFIYKAEIGRLGRKAGMYVKRK